MSRIGIIGSGAVAQSLGRALHDRGAPIVVVASRHPERTAHAAAFIGASVGAVSVSDVPALASHVIVAVSDEAIAAVAGQLAEAGFAGGVAVHTCGAKGPEVLSALRPGGTACGVLHPLQTVPSPDLGVRRLQRITFGIGGDPAAVAWGETIVALLESRALHVAAGGFPAYHAAATLAGNAVAALVDSAVSMMERAGVDADRALEALAPLCRASAENVLAVGPVAALTGPIARGDAATVAEHLRALAAAPPDVAELYIAAGTRLLDLARRRGLDAGAARRIDRLLHDARPGRTEAPALLAPTLTDS